MKFPTLPVDVLDDGLIECGDYAEWAEACTEIKRRPYDRGVLDELMKSISEEGLLEPLMIEIEVRNRGDRPFLSNGHHRAVALFELGIKEFPYEWCWRFPKGQSWPAPGDPLPSHVLDALGVPA